MQLIKSMSLAKTSKRQSVQCPDRDSVSTNYILLLVFNSDYLDELF